MDRLSDADIDRMLERARAASGKLTTADNQPSGLAQASHLISRRAADITPRQIDFLWAGRLARGKHTAFAGEPGDGKSQLSIYMAATVSRGGEWPCNEGQAPLGNVIIFNAEDGADDTIVPRLIAAGADMERVHIVSAVVLEDGKGRRTFNLQADLALLEDKIREIGDVALVIIDPISSYMGKADSHKNAEVRGALEPLSEMAERMKVAVLSITHFSKAGSGNTNKALHRFIGSIAFVGAPRAAFAVIEDADNEGRILVLHAKNNMAPKPQGLAYRLLQTIVEDNIVASYVHWEDAPVTVSADQALAATSGGAEQHSARREAEDFLRETLTQPEGVAATEVAEAAQALGIAPRTLRRARKSLGVLAEKGGMEGGWTWRLPVEGGQCPPKKANSFSGHLRENLTPFEEASASEAPDCDKAARGPNGHGDQDVTAADTPSTVPDDDGQDTSELYDDGLGFLRRCHHCGQPGAALVAVDGRSIGLHRECETSWLDSHGGPHR
jgi:putative DNA primase/helicase